MASSFWAGGYVSISFWRLFSVFVFSTTALIHFLICMPRKVVALSFLSFFVTFILGGGFLDLFDALLKYQDRLSTLLLWLIQTNEPPFDLFRMMCLFVFLLLSWSNTWACLFGRSFVFRQVYEWWYLDSRWMHQPLSASTDRISHEDLLKLGTTCPTLWVNAMFIYHSLRLVVSSLQRDDQWRILWVFWTILA